MIRRTPKSDPVMIYDDFVLHGSLGSFEINFGALPRVCPFDNELFFSVGTVVVSKFPNNSNDR